VAIKVIVEIEVELSPKNLRA